MQPTMRRSLNVIAGLSAGLLVILSGRATAATPPGDRLHDEVHQAYQQTRQYQATLRFAVEQPSGRWTVTQEGEFSIAFDRDASALKVDGPDFRLVTRGDTLRLNSGQIPDNHLELDAPEPLTYANLLTRVPVMTDPLMIDVVFLLSDRPIGTISDGAASSATPLPPEEDDAQQRPRLRLDTVDGVMTLYIDPQTRLVSRAVEEIDASKIGGEGIIRILYDYDVTAHNAALDADAFAFDTTNSTAHASFESLVSSVGGGAGGGGAGSGHPLEGEAAPAIETRTASGQAFDLDAVEAEVVVLDFWATWCPPCREGLPELEKVAAWAEAESKPVAVYTVNVGETVEDVRAFWEANGLTMPVLMDEDVSIATAYGASSIPQTVLIRDGVVEKVHVGFAPGMSDHLKADIEQMLAKTPQ